MNGYYQFLGKLILEPNQFFLKLHNEVVTRVIFFSQVTVFL